MCPEASFHKTLQSVDLQRGLAMKSPKLLYGMCVAAFGSLDGAL